MVVVSSELMPRLVSWFAPVSCFMPESVFMPWSAGGTWPPAALFASESGFALSCASAVTPNAQSARGKHGQKIGLIFI